MGVNNPAAGSSNRHREQPGAIDLLERAFDILDVFREGPGQRLGVTQIAHRVGLPKSSVHRILASLVSLEAIERDGHDYQLGMRLFELGEHVPRKRDLREAALPFMEDLYEVTHETIHLAVLDGTEVLYIERIQGHNKYRQLASRVGGRLPAHCTGVGKALLSFNPESVTALLSRGTLEARTAYTITSPRVLVEELAKIRQRGLATDRDESAIGIHCVATPIILAGKAIAAMSVTGPPQRIDEQRLGSALRTAGLGLQRTLGATKRQPAQS